MRDESNLFSENRYDCTVGFWVVSLPLVPFYSSPSFARSCFAFEMQFARVQWTTMDNVEGFSQYIRYLCRSFKTSSLREIKDIYLTFSSNFCISVCFLYHFFCFQNAFSAPSYRVQRPSSIFIECIFIYLFILYIYLCCYCWFAVFFHKPYFFSHPLKCHQSAKRVFCHCCCIFICLLLSSCYVCCCFLASLFLFNYLVLMNFSFDRSALCYRRRAFWATLVALGNWHSIHLGSGRLLLTNRVLPRPEGVDRFAEDGDPWRHPSVWTAVDCIMMFDQSTHLPPSPYTQRHCTRPTKLFKALNDAKILFLYSPCWVIPPINITLDTQDGIISDSSRSRPRLHLYCESYKFLIDPLHLSTTCLSLLSLSLSPFV